MPLPRAPLLLLWAGLGSFVPRSRCGSSRHSLCYSYLKVSEPSQGLPQFFSMVHLDDQPIARYDSPTRRMVPLVPWMEAAEVKTPERMFRGDLEWLSKLNPQTGGLHTWQVILGCELREDGSKGGFLHYGYDGMDFISFDKETHRWVAAQPQAQTIKEKWEEDPVWSQGNKDFLEETCIEWLQTYLSYQKEALKKTEPPLGKVTHKMINDSLETLICQAFGFHPKEIQVTWRRKRKVVRYETLHRNVAPNSDGTYYVWLSIEIDPKERNHFQCHLEHEGLQEPLVLAWKEDTARLSWITVGIVAAITAGIWILYRSCNWLGCREILHQDETIRFHRRDLENSPLIYCTEDEIQSQAVLQPKSTSEGCCGQKTELREGEKTPLMASPVAYSDNEEGPAPGTLQWDLEERLEDAEATKPGMEGLEEEVRPRTSEEQVDEHLAGEERGEMQLEGLTDPGRSPGWRRIVAATDQKG
ncbi:major histocompatibility complex class I-related gene protein-like [Pituophis catenifer annectens]|uniref:major histocompatibility complex class I-related gene protein-like n=1 Tax=Pituophis catenifer annectens TaxID=94852 RepID=UPI003992C46A